MRSGFALLAFLSLAGHADSAFNRIASFPVCLLDNPACSDQATSAEIVTASTDGMTLIFTDSPAHRLGFIDISDPAAPAAAGVVALSGEPTSVTVVGDFIVVAVNTAANFVDVSGSLSVFRVSDRSPVRSILLGGQPDSVAVSPDGSFIAVAIENERDEDLGDGRPEQLPGGFVVVVDSSDADPLNWVMQPIVNLSGIPDLFENDPEPEFVDINSNNILVVTLQENNYIVLIDLATNAITAHFTAGVEDLTLIDTEEESPSIISLVGSLNGVKREPDGVAWIGTDYFVTANEGDMDGGSRGFTVFDTAGNVVWTSGPSLEHMTVRYGHYPDSRSGNKGNEPENVEVGKFGGTDYLFVNSERSSLVFVYDVTDPRQPAFKQVLPAGVAPEGGLAIPSRDLLIVASEEDNRSDKIRSVVNIYQYSSQAAEYPTIESENRTDGTPIPWGALSGLSRDPQNDSLLYSIEDSYYGSSRIFTIDVSTKPAKLIAELKITDANNVLAALATSGTSEDDASFDDVDLAAMINADGSVNIDPEGVTTSADGGFWIASEGAGTLSDAANRPLTSLNMLIKTDMSGVITQVVTLPDAVNAKQVRFGFEGVAEYNGKLYVAMQRAWEGESNPRIGIYSTSTASWDFVYYPLDAPSSQAGGWVGLSDIAAVGAGSFLVVERDNQGGPDAALKRLYRVDLSEYEAGETVAKTLVEDIMDELRATGSPIPEKIEGVAVMSNGDVFIVNDNDGIDANSGQTLLLNLGPLAILPDSDSLHFNRVASFAVCSQEGSTCNSDEATAAEIVTATKDGMTLVYTDSPGKRIGLIDIKDPSMPKAAGVVALNGEPTSVSMVGEYAVIGVNTAANFVDVSGRLSVVRVSDLTEVRSIDLGGQPDSVAVSPDGSFIAVAIENERDEDLGDGRPEQLPGGFVVVVDSSDADPLNWVMQPIVNLSGIPDLFENDPEPEFVDINSNNILVVTLQENNYIVLIDLATNAITAHFTAGVEDLTLIDTEEESPSIISLVGSLNGVKREPDGVAWIGTDYFVTANEGDMDEGDMDGGSRGFTVFDTAGNVVWTSGPSLEHMTVRYGHYPDSRSGNKGNEPENVEVGKFGGTDYLFVNSERSSLVFVYDVTDPRQPAFKQVLPAGVAPEGGLAIPSRDLLIVASEEDNRSDKIRSVVNIYQYSSQAAEYPTIESENRTDGTPIPWGALSGLSRDPQNDSLLYSIEDSYYGSSRIFTIDVSTKPAKLIAELKITDANNVLAALATSGTSEDDASFDDVDLAAMINADGSVNIDPEGVTTSADGGFWIASEGAGTLSDAANRPLTSLNMLIKTDMSGVITQVVTLPDAVNAKQVRFGFEGVAEYNGKLYVAMQRAWEGESNPRIGIYSTSTASWDFVYYPLDAPSSQAGGWVGLSDIAAVGAGSFLVVERDNQGGPDAALKRLYRVDLSEYEAGETVAKTLVEDLMDELRATGSPIPEKIEGVAVMSNGDVFIVNDNDGIDANSGLTLLLKTTATVGVPDTPNTLTPISPPLTRTPGFTPLTAAPVRNEVLTVRVRTDLTAKLADFEGLIRALVERMRSDLVGEVTSLVFTSLCLRARNVCLVGGEDRKDLADLAATLGPDDVWATSFDVNPSSSLESVQKAIVARPAMVTDPFGSGSALESIEYEETIVSEDDDELGSGTIAGIVIAVVAGIIVIGAAIALAFMSGGTEAENNAPDI
ncbi:hypothetical protein DIPPA_09208 [Diplonema papillatum]|nr:hypothetical protein DIPPA_09208 [Diplonema papillatum]